ncbi:MAG: hypothetical protein ACOYLX_23440, partial [Burkholderiaceae bacterium]
TLSLGGNIGLASPTLAAVTDAVLPAPPVLTGTAAACGSGCTVEVRAWPYERGGGAGWTEEIAASEARTVAFVIGMSLPPRQAGATERIDVAGR